MCCACWVRTVAPHAGAWIETKRQLVDLLEEESPLMQGRGLKHVVIEVGCGFGWSPLMQGRGLKRAKCPGDQVLGLSPLMQGRGLKPLGHQLPKREQVAPHAGAWIETNPALCELQRHASPLMQGRGLKQACHADVLLICRRPSCRGVD